MTDQINRLALGDTLTLDGFEIEKERDPDGGYRYPVYTPSGRQWADPVGAPHITMAFSVPEVRTLVAAPLVACPPGCECCWDDTP